MEVTEVKEYQILISQGPKLRVCPHPPSEFSHFIFQILHVSLNNLLSHYLPYTLARQGILGGGNVKLVREFVACRYRWSSLSFFLVSAWGMNFKAH